MSEGQRPPLLAYLRRLGRAELLEGSDAELLERFAEQRDDIAFSALLRRHGPLVWGVCRRVLAEEHAAEDAFQATFLVLVRKARSVSKKASVRSWLYGVALRVAVRARQRDRARHSREQTAAERRSAGAGAEASWQDMRPILDEEIQRLPEKYRLPLILCYLEGRTNDEAAAALRCPRGTIATRLARGRERLRARLIRRGLTLSAGTLAALLADSALSAAVPPLLLAQTAKSAVLGAAPVSITILAEGMLHAMFVTKMKSAFVLLLALSGLGIASVGTYALQVQKNAPPPAEPARAAPEKAKPDKGADRLRMLLQQRRDQAAQEHKVRYDKYRAGAQDATLDLAIASSKRLLKAELELAKDKAEQRAAHERHIAFMKEVAGICKRKYDVGRISLADLAQAEYERLDTEIALEREKAR